MSVATTTTAAVATTNEVAKAVKKVYKNSTKLRIQKAESSKRFRDRKNFVEANPGVAVPAELEARVGWHKRKTEVITADMSQAQISEIESITKKREAKRLASERHHFIKKNGKDAELPAHLQLAPKAPKAEKVAKVKATKEAAPEVVEAPITLQEMVYEQGDTAFKMSAFGKNAYQLRKYKIEGDKKKSVSVTTLKRAELPTTNVQWNKLIAQA